MFHQLVLQSLRPVDIIHYEGFVLFEDVKIICSFNRVLFGDRLATPIVPMDNGQGHIGPIHG